MRLSIAATTTVALLLVLNNVLTPVGAARRQKRWQRLKPQQQKYTYGRNTEALGRSADIVDAPDADASVGDEATGDSGRGFMAKWMMLKSMLQPPQPPPQPFSNIIIVTEPSSNPVTTPTTTTITSPTYTYSTPTSTTPTTTTTTTNATRGHFTHVVYARQDNGVQEGGELAAPTMTNAPQLTGNAGIPLFMGRKPGMTNQIPMIGQFPRPAGQRRRNNRGRLNQNVRRRRVQAQQRIGGERNKPVNNYNKRRRLQAQGVGGKPLQQRPQRRKVVQIPNRIRNVHRKGNSGDGVVIVNEVDQFGVGAGNKFNTNSRLQHFRNNLRHPQSPLVRNRH